MIFRVPLLLHNSWAVIHRLNMHGTKDVRPHTGSTSGYDPDFKEPIVYDELNALNTTVRDTGRVEFPPIKVPCQLEVIEANRLNMEQPGHMETYILELVFHVMDLETLKLINRQSRKLLLQIGDRVSTIEGSPTDQNTKSAFALPEEGLFIKGIRPGSPGFGYYGFDLFIATLGIRELSY